MFSDRDFFGFGISTIQQPRFKPYFKSNNFFEKKFFRSKAALHRRKSPVILCPNKKCQKSVKSKPSTDKWFYKLSLSIKISHALKQNSWSSNELWSWDFTNGMIIYSWYMMYSLSCYINLEDLNFSKAILEWNEPNRNLINLRFFARISDFNFFVNSHLQKNNSTAKGQHQGFPDRWCPRCKGNPEN